VEEGRLAEVRRRVAMPGQALMGHAVEEVVHVVTKPEHPSLVQSNRAFHCLCLDGKPWFYFAIAA
jgi:hypothetical protein